MQKTKGPLSITEKSLFSWAFTGNLKLQLLLLFAIILVVFARVLPLEMQKRIINDSIALQNMQGLVIYCSIYILAITAASGLKMAINSLQTLIGERAMLAMRQALYHHILTLPLSFFRTTQPGTVVAALMTELSTAGNFAGMAFAVPVTNILTLVAFTGYLLWLNVKLALATLIIYPMVVLILPLLQKKANKANKKRVDLSRETASLIAESISGIHEIQVHGAYEQEANKFDKLAEKLKKTRIRWSILKFAIKIANNYFVGLGPFVVFVYGAYLIMHGELELGAMVAFLSAQEKLFDPWKEMIEFYQTYQDASISYSRTMRSFNVAAEFPIDVDETANLPLSGNLVVSDLVLDTLEGHRLLNGVSFSLNAGEHLAVVGYSGGGKSTLIQCIGKMFHYSAGSIQLDGRELSTLSKHEAIRNIGYVSQNPFIFTGTIGENLLYAYQTVTKERSEPTEEERRTDLDRMILALQHVGLFVDVMRFGLDSRIAGDQETLTKIIGIRRRFRETFSDLPIDFVEFYDRAAYHGNSNVAENIFFGSCSSPILAAPALPGNKGFCDFLQSMNLLLPLQELGLRIAGAASATLGDGGARRCISRKHSAAA